MKKVLKKVNVDRDSYMLRLVLAFVVASCWSALPVLAQTDANPPATGKTVVGVVRDAHSKQPIGAAEVTIPVLNISSVTDENGRFELKDVTSPLSVLRVKAYDYHIREIGLQGKDSLLVDLYPDVFGNYFKPIALNTGVTENSALTASAKSMDGLANATAFSVDELIQPGLGGDVRAVTRSGVTGQGAALFIRGMNTLNGNSQPLYVVDGVIWNNMHDVVSLHEGLFLNPLDNIEVSDIESVTVMKDGTSIYGSKGANGVVLINTKRAKSMVTKINLRTIQGVVDRPEVLPLMTGEQYRTYASDMLGSMGIPGNVVSGMDFLQTDPSNPVYNTYHNNTDWADFVYRQAVHKSYVINAQGGDEAAMYYFSLGYTGNEEIVKEKDFQRINTRFNADFKFSEIVKMGLNIGFNRNQRHLTDDGVNNYTSPTWISMLKSPFLSPYKYTSKGQITQSYAFADEFGVSNPMGVIRYSVNDLKKYRFNIGLLPTVQINPYLKFSSQFDYNEEKNVESHFDPYLYVPARMLDGYGITYNNTSSQELQNTSIFNDSRLMFDKRFNKQSHLKAMWGWRYLRNYFESDHLEEHNSKSNTKTTITGDYDFLQTRGLNYLSKSISNYVNAEYSFDNRLFLNGAVAVDGSSRFGNQTEGGFQMFGHSWGVFPSVNAAWLISAERFMKHVGWLPYLKLRAGYGLTGNDGIQDYESMAYFASVQFMSRANGVVLANIANNKIQWETTGRANVGIDAALFNDRVNLSADYFTSKTSDLLTIKELPYFTGLNYSWSNGGALKSNGFEVSANIKALNLKNIKWELGASAGHYQSEITELDNGRYTTQVYGGEVLTAVGQPVGVFYGYKTQGVYATAADASAANLKIRNSDGTYTPFTAGDVRFTENPNAVDGVIDEKDKQVIGNPNPDLYGTLSSRLTYKRLSLNTVFTYSLGNDVYNYYRSMLESGMDLHNQSAAMVSRWTADGQHTKQPKAVYGDPMGNARFSDRWIEDGSYLRLKTVSLSYSLPLKGNVLQGVTVWASANNLVTFTKYLGVDPEFSSRNSVYFQGVDAGLTPLTRSYYLGVNFNL